MSDPTRKTTVPDATWSSPAGCPPLRVGDIVFTRVTARPFMEVADATACWTNHVGIVVRMDGPEPVLAESTFPRARLSTWTRFVGRSQRQDGGHRVAVMRLAEPWSATQRQALDAAVSSPSVTECTGAHPV